MGENWPVDEVGSAFAQVMELLQGTTGFKFGEEEMRNTPKRVAKMYLELIANQTELKMEADAILSKVFECNSREMVVMSNIRSVGLCPHHLLPIHYKVHVAYIPDRVVIGASKFPRLVKLLGRQPLMQETYTSQIADMITEHLKPKGVGTIVRGVHGCMKSRGVKEHSSEMVTSAMRGVFLTEAHAKQEFLSLLNTK